MALGIVLGATGIGSLVMNSAAGGIVSQLISTITAPISAVVLLMVGYELNLKKELLGPVLKTIVLRLIIMAGLLVLANMIIFHLFPFDLCTISDRNHRYYLLIFRHIKEISYCFTVTNSHNQCIKP